MPPNGRSHVPAISLCSMDRIRTVTEYYLVLSVLLFRKSLLCDMILVSSFTELFVPYPLCFSCVILSSSFYPSIFSSCYFKLPIFFPKFLSDSIHLLSFLSMLFNQPSPFLSYYSCHPCQVTRIFLSKRHSVIAITLHYVSALSYNVLTLWRNVIASISYRSEQIGAVIASYSYCSKLMDQRYCFLLVIAFPDLNLLFNLCNKCSHNEIIE
jgi:hypothetical protein